ncbi:hypothetical protein GOC55_30455 [Sinorhizobium medicae]|uniref:hypothetical protein n=1 Tax=Sinorhizobium medicae TaxID=110321 RepID=UPI00047F41F5|nr:hypothetical protein [Sinorhizobium medicae]MDX0451744.1 hypothetical protein [Sinorhizobium medicae]MDX0537678.1 hypothetical protein [Sinorhizobium medicae]MDX1047684.1 hypothetical protein [Sinorhizobium medicae]MDX1060550.1 hypothetical protein [Sinorhizobium medicae]MDX1134479.1 hypothetical protein [Sinorhizobium medicae]
MATFNPNSKSLAQCIAEIEQFRISRNLDNKQIITSRDVPDLWKAKELAVSNVPGGFNKIILPFYTDGAATFYISSAGPYVKVPRHSHDEGNGIRIIMSGSIFWDGLELQASEWMYLKAGAPYEFEVGPRGVSIFYCYQCCCA